MKCEDLTLKIKILVLCTGHNQNCLTVCSQLSKKIKRGSKPSTGVSFSSSNKVPIGELQIKISFTTLARILCLY